MAKKLYTEVGGYSKKVKKLYTEVGGVSHKVKKLYAEVGGVSKMVYSAGPFSYSFTTYANSSNALNQIFALTTWSAGFKPDGSILLAIHGNNVSSGTDVGAPASKVIITFEDPASMAGKTVKIRYNQQFSRKAYNDFKVFIRKSGETFSALSITTDSGSDHTFTHIVESDTISLELAAIAGGTGSVICNITITSITVDGEEVLR